MPSVDATYALLLRSLKAAIHEGGGEYVGIQAGVRRAGSPDLVLFNDPLTRTTLALVADQSSTTTQQVRAKIAHSRRLFAELGKRGNDEERLRQAAPRRSLWSGQTACADAP